MKLSRPQMLEIPSSNWPCDGCEGGVDSRSQR